MVYPLSRLKPDEPQIVFDGSPDELDHCGDPRVLQFVEGEAGERLMEMRRLSHIRENGGSHVEQ
jgi:phospholipid/cholesterol/gamma-HCH transport system ATP-binding protein